jgi:hypothetical protein
MQPLKMTSTSILRLNGLVSGPRSVSFDLDAISSSNLRLPLRMKMRISPQPKRRGVSETSGDCECVS